MKLSLGVSKLQLNEVTLHLSSDTDWAFRNSIGWLQDPDPTHPRLKDVNYETWIITPLRFDELFSNRLQLNPLLEINKMKIFQNNLLCEDYPYILARTGESATRSGWNFPLPCELLSFYSVSLESDYLFILVLYGSFVYFKSVVSSCSIF